MRILFLSNFYPPYDIGGYEQWCCEVAHQLMERSHTVHVLTSRYGVRSGYRHDASNVTRTLYLQENLDYYRPLDFFLRHSYRERRNIQELQTIIVKFKPEIVMIWGMWNLSLNLPYWTEQWMDGRVAYFISSYWPMDLDPHTAYWKLPARRAYLERVKHPIRKFVLAKLQQEGYPPQLRYKHAVCCSKYVRDTLIKADKLGSDAGVLYGGTDPEPFLRHSRFQGSNKNNGNKSLNLLYFGRLIRDKGVHTAIKSLGLIKRDGKIEKTKLTILGNGHPAYEAELRALVSKFDLSEHVTFVAQVPRDAIPVILGRYDVYLFTSIWPEPMARSVMEAMAAGLLVIGTPVGGQKEMLFNNENALIFETDNAESLANQIEYAIKNPTIRINLAHTGQKIVLERFTLNRMVDDIEQYLVEINRNEPSLENLEYFA